MLEAYLDIETTGLSSTYDGITVIGIYLTDGSHHRFVQLVGEEVTGANLLRTLRGVDTIYTYNGTGFDLPFINASLGIDLVKDFKHLYGGFKGTALRFMARTSGERNTTAEPLKPRNTLSTDKT